ncbi:hypothetical protein JVT61DRAFT_4580 [Boletus reticuloceps]|uniref:Glutaminase A N-terminal domain-containing protein n=1 Tax=Boletus reticuloceps TaxID=495285 RepID=A0A8I2YM77_9AGAM|nr:hypothetical protein JVT61DRAFT_4580 [Boletus reticuloceps]
MASTIGRSSGLPGYVPAYTILGDSVVSRTSPVLATQNSMHVAPRYLFDLEPSDLVKQFTPFSYLTVQAISTDGAAHTVNVYTDISAEWACASNNT